MSYRFCLLLTVLMLLVANAAHFAIIIPFIGVIQELANETGRTVPVSPLVPVKLGLSVPFWMSVFFWALGCLVASLSGCKSESGRKNWWIVLIVLSCVGAISALFGVLAAPKFAEMFKDIGLHL